MQAMDVYELVKIYVESKHRKDFIDRLRIENLIDSDNSGFWWDLINASSDMFGDDF